jgi:membrane-bound lytic murein transglycosylase B
LCLLALALSTGGSALAASPAATAAGTASLATTTPTALAPASARTAQGSPAPADLASFDLTRPEIRAYVAEARAQGLSAAHVIAVLAAAKPQPQIIDAMNRPAEKTLQWWEYRARMLTPARIEAGAQLWREHKELLDQIAADYQVPPEYLVAVLGVETLYGRITGRYRVIDALATLAFDYPPRGEYFRHELTQFLLLSHEQHFDPLSVRGSYAGAMGALQFMPSSYRKYAVSLRHGARSDLWDDWGDIFASTANFLHQAGWQDGAPVLAETHYEADPKLAPPDHMQLSATLGQLRAQGLAVDSSLPDTTAAVLIAAPEQDAMRYRVGFQNFYVITRYNDSPAYAMAVFDLARGIRERIALDAAF